MKIAEGAKELALLAATMYGNGGGLSEEEMVAGAWRLVVAACAQLEKVDKAESEGATVTPVEGKKSGMMTSDSMKSALYG
jgi:hypothetical protein